ncbi:clathrin light chain [Salix suchowensis]|nr:clathrin light chain [Salix suchowensis]
MCPSITPVLLLKCSASNLMRFPILSSESVRVECFSREEGAKCLSGWLSRWRAEIDKNNHIFKYLALAPGIPPPVGDALMEETSNHASFDEVDDESYSNFSSYPTAAAAPGEFSGEDVFVDHASASTKVFGFGSDAVPNYSHQSPFRSVHSDNGNGSNEYNGADDGFFVSDGPIHPPPTEMEPEEGFALR